MRLILGNCKEELKTIEDNSIDSIVTDPPYELGFMGKKWDNSGIAYDIEVWKECLRVLKPGGHLLAFSGTRTYHRMAVAIEDAGFEVRDMIEWVYGSGFPKSLNIGKAVDKLQGNERDVIETNETIPDIRANNYSNSDGKARLKANITKGTSEWEGWGTALKPAHEPICMARKPLGEKTVAKNVLKWGTGGINIDESRVEIDPIADASQLRTMNRSAKEEENGWGMNQNGGDKPQVVIPKGRFPANLIHDNSEEVRECFPETKTGDLNRTNTAIWGNAGGLDNIQHKGSSGNASRFFKSIIYQAKASKAERNKGCEGLEEKLGGSLEGGNDKRKGKDKPQLKPTKNNHPTVKPIALMEYLIKMVTPKGGTVLDPFMGSGSTGCAAVKNGFDFIGIDMTEDYLTIAKARIKAHKNEIPNTIDFPNKLQCSY